MPLEFHADEVRLLGTCVAEDALELAEWLGRTTAPKVDLSACVHLHTSLLQTLIAYAPAIVGAPSDAFLTRWVLPLLAANREAA
jgi:hypothetical protein